MQYLFIDIETFSSVDIKTSGMYKYIESDDFEILLIGYSLDGINVNVIDLLSGEEIPEEFENAMLDENVVKVAHNASFERVSLNKIGYTTETKEWLCTAALSAYNGLPLSLDQVSKTLDLVDKKQASGKLLIKYFSCPVKPRAGNGWQERNYPEHAPDKWELYKEYNKYDVLAEIEIFNKLKHSLLPKFEKDVYVLDQCINDRGILIDVELAKKCIDLNEQNTAELTSRAIEITELPNPNSVSQLKGWIQDKTGIAVQSLAKDQLDTIREQFDDPDIDEVLDIRAQLSRSSVKKYYAMLSCLCKDNRVRGTFQYYGASRTGRWAGRLLQLQNLPKNHTSDIDGLRNDFRNQPLESLSILYSNISDLLSQLVRTCFISPEHQNLIVADFSAIEARVVSWLADEEWRLEVFRGDGKIYEAAAARMFNVPIESVTKDSDLRAKAKNAELALGYGGFVGAMKRMGGDKMGLSENEMISIVNVWRAANKKIVNLWAELDECVRRCIGLQEHVELEKKNYKLLFDYCDDGCLRITLPSNRTLCYREARISKNKILYSGIEQTTRQWMELDLYGGKITENVVQAISRDILCESMIALEKAGFKVVMHVHDEVIAEYNEDKTALQKMIGIMRISPKWAPNLPLNAAGFISKYYMKD